MLYTDGGCGFRGASGVVLVDFYFIYFFALAFFIRTYS